MAFPVSSFSSVSLPTDTRKRWCFVPLITNRLRFSMSLCVNMVHIGFIAKCRIDTMLAFRRVYFYLCIKVETGNLSDMATQLLPVFLGRNGNWVFYTLLYGIKRQRFDRIPHLQQSVVL